MSTTQGPPPKTVTKIIASSPATTEPNTPVDRPTDPPREQKPTSEKSVDDSERKGGSLCNAWCSVS